MKEVNLQEDTLNSLLSTLIGVVKGCELPMTRKVALGLSRQAVARPGVYWS